MSVAETVTIPGTGKKVPKWAAAAGLGGTAILIILYYRQHKAGAAAPAAAAGSAGQYPPDGTTGDPSDLYSTDPATGQTYGDEATGSGGSFGLAGGVGGIGGDGDFPWDGTYNNPSDPDSLDTSTGTTFGQEGTSPGITGQGGPPFSTNSQWSNWVIGQLTSQNPNTDTGALTDALGLYLAGQQVEPAQKTLILDAEAIGGPPPVAGPGGYPPNVQTDGNKGPAPAAPSVTVPAVRNMQVNDAIEALQKEGLGYHLSSERNSKDTYIVNSQTPAAGTHVAKGSIVRLGIAPHVFK